MLHKWKDMGRNWGVWAMGRHGWGDLIANWPRKEAMDKESKFGVFTMGFAEGSWALYLIYFCNNYIANSYDCYSLEVVYWTLIMQKSLCMFQDIEWLYTWFSLVLYFVSKL
jgi:hypothetical protein